MRFLASFFFLFLAACGFQPVHAPLARQGSSHAVLQYVSLETIEAGRAGQILQTELEDLLHPDGAYPTPRYRLAATLTETKQPIVIEQNARVSRYNLLLVAKYTLTDLNSGATVYANETRRLGSYNASLSDFSTFVAESDARNRTVKQLAQDIAMRVTAKLKGLSALQGGLLPPRFALPHASRLALLGWVPPSEEGRS